MKTLILRLGPKKDAGHPVDLFVDEGLDPKWLETPRASALIPDHPDMTPPVEEPVSGQPFKGPTTGQLLTGRVAREQFMALEDEAPLVGEIGRYLFHLVFQGEIADAWKELRAKYPREEPPHHEGLRLILDIRSPELEDLPWELLCERTRRLFVDGTLVALRGSIDVSGSKPVLRKEWPLRALIVIGSPESDARIEWKKELEAIEVAFQEMRHMVDYEVLREPSRKDLRDAFANLRPHIFHFIGHGRKEVGSGKIGLVLQQKSPPWIEDLVVNDLAGAPPPRLVILNACYSADALDPERLWSLTQSFRHLGAASVVGMRGEIKGAVSATFAAELYKALATGATLDRAVQEARAQVGTRLPSYDQRDWALPVFWISELPEKVLPPTVANSSLLQKFRASAEDYERIRDFIDRKQERRVAIGAVEPAAVIPLHSTTHLLVVTGRSNVGKTTLILWCLEGCAHHRRFLAYVDLQGRDSKNFLEVLRAIRDGDPPRNSPIRQPLPPKHFYQFNQDLNFLLKGQQPLTTPPPGPVVDEGLPFNPDLLPEKGAIEHIFKSFLEALRKVGGEQPLVLVLDNLRGVFAAHFRQYIRPYLVDRIASGELASVRLVLSVRDTEASDWLNDQQQPLPPHKRIELSHFSCEEYPTLASDFLRRQVPDTHLREQLVKAVHAISLAGNSHYTWDASELENLRLIAGSKGGGKR